MTRVLINNLLTYTAFFTLILLSNAANAAIEVTATGVGHNRSSAIKEAQRAAVSQGVGLALESRQITEDNETIKLRIVTSSHGFIQRYDLISEGTNDFGHTVKIHAFVNECVHVACIRVSCRTLIREIWLLYFVFCMWLGWGFIRIWIWLVR